MLITVQAAPLAALVDKSTDEQLTAAEYTTLKAAVQEANAGLRSANMVYAGPSSGSPAAGTFRTLVVADIPTLTAAKISDFNTAAAAAAPVQSVAGRTGTVTITSTDLADFASAAAAAAPVQSVAGRTGAVTLTYTDIGGLGAAATRGVGTSSGNLVEVQSDGTILASLLPPLAISQPFTVASQAAMLALTAQRGDVAIRTDENKSYILSTDSPSTLADWKELLSPTDGVFTFNGRAGTVTLVAADVQELLAVTDLTTYASVSGTGTVALRTTITSPQTNDVLTWNGTNWVNAAPAGGTTFPLLANDTYNVATPSYSRAGDPNTGWGFPAADTLAAIVGGAVRAQWDSVGLNVGDGRLLFGASIGAPTVALFRGGNGILYLTDNAASFGKMVCNAVYGVADFTIGAAGVDDIWDIKGANGYALCPGGDGTYGIGSPTFRVRDVHNKGPHYQTEVAANPTTSDLAAIGGASGQVASYPKGDKMVLAAINLAGVMNFLTVPLDGSTTTLTWSTSAP